MLSILASLLTAAAATAIEIVVAPDQPAPYIYADEPLVLELRVSSSARVEVSATARGQRGEIHEVDWGALILAPDEPHWLTWAEFPRGMGVYSLSIVLNLGMEAETLERTVCRIQRPSDAAALPAEVNVQDASMDALFALRSAGIRYIRLSGNSPDATRRIAQAQDVGFSVTIAFDGVTPLPDSHSLEEMARAEGGVSSWEIALGRDADAFAQNVLTLRRAAPRIPVIASIETTGDAPRLFGGKMGGLCNGVALIQRSGNAAQLVEIRAVAEACGYEGLSYCSIRPSGERPDVTDAVEDYLAGTASGFSKTVINSSKLFSESNFSSGYMAFTAMLHEVGDARYLGEITGDDRPRVHVFRDAASPGGWTVAISGQGLEGESSSVFEGATVIGAVDSVGDPQPLRGESFLGGSAGPDNRLLFVKGYGGKILLRAVGSSIQREALGLLAVENHEAILSPETVEALKLWSESPEWKSERFRFLTLIRAFPELEEKWHSGTIPRATAMQLISGISRLARGLAVVEHETGKPFLEPLQEMLARCGEYQSLYLTSTGAASDARARADWLFEEVNALTAQARQLAEGGRAIEADAIAAIAEWRARALSHASQAKPLGHYEEPVP